MIKGRLRCKPVAVKQKLFLKVSKLVACLVKLH